MKALFGNSCAKGCLVYFVALIAIVAVTTMGLGGLKGRFDVGSRTPQGSIFTVGDKQIAPGNPPADGGGGGVDTLPTIAPLPPIQPAQPVQPTVEALPTLVAPAGPTVPAGPIAFTPVPSQGGVISGETVAPFYLVQSGDTLWDISLRFGLTVDMLRAANNLTDNIIQPGQVLSLPSQSSQSQPTAVGVPTVATDFPPVIIPLMPNTGIIKDGER